MAIFDSYVTNYQRVRLKVPVKSQVTQEIHPVHPQMDDPSRRSVPKARVPVQVLQDKRGRSPPRSA